MKGSLHLETVRLNCHVSLFPSWLNPVTFQMGLSGLEYEFGHFMC